MNEREALDAVSRGEVTPDQAIEAIETARLLELMGRDAKRQYDRLRPTSHGKGSKPVKEGRRKRPSR